MTARGRISAAEIAVAGHAAVERVARPDPPDEYGMTDEQVMEWWAVVDRMPADWFPRETHGLLAQFCRHVVTQRRVAQMIEAAEEEEQLDIIKLDRLYKMQEREGRAMTSLATKMRMSQQSTYDKQKSTGKVRSRAPWKS